jgi:hypothetical protein
MRNAEATRRHDSLAGISRRGISPWRGVQSARNPCEAIAVTASNSSASAPFALVTNSYVRERTEST